MKINKKVVGQAVKLVGSFSVYTVVGTLIENSLPGEMKIVKRFLVGFGSIIICSMAAEKAEEWFDKKFGTGETEEIKSENPV